MSVRTRNFFVVPLAVVACYVYCTLNDFALFRITLFCMRLDTLSVCITSSPDLTETTTSQLTSTYKFSSVCSYVFYEIFFTIYFSK